MSEYSRLRAGAMSAERWALPAIEGNILGTRRPEHDSEAQERARARVAAAEAAIARVAAEAAAETAREAARELGYQAGLATAQQEMQPKLDRLNEQVSLLDQTLTLLARPLADMDEEVQAQLARLATAVGRQLARRELTADPGQVIAIIREAVGRLPAAARDVRVHLNPRDAAVVRERLASPAQDRAWTMLEDPTLTEGGCLVRSDSSQIDARLESRLNAIAAELFGETRTRHSAAQPGPSSAPATDPSLEST